MKYLEAYDNNKQGIKRNIIKKYFLNKLDKKYKLLGHDSLSALYMNRLLNMWKIKEKNLSILEIGGGDGYFLSSNHAVINRKIMVDIDDYYKDKFAKDGIEFYCVDISKERLLTIKDNSISAVVLNHVIEHIHNIDFFIKEIKRILKPNGVLYIRTPDIKKVGFEFYDDFTHVRPFTPISLEHMMNMYGFDTLEILKSNMSTIKLEDLFGVKHGKLGFLNANEIESLFIKVV